MRYVCMHKVTPSTEAFQLPSKELIEGMGNLIGEVARDGRFLGGGGLQPSDRRHRLRLEGDRWHVVKGAKHGDHSLPAALVMIEVRRLEDGLAWAERYGRALGVQEVELGPTTEPWHLGLVPEPANPPLHFLIVPMATAATEAGTAPTPAQLRAVAELEAEMAKAGVLQFSTRLQASARAARLHFRDGKRTLVDGPFVESKELVGGFCMLEMPTFDEMLAWVDRYGRILAEDLEIDIRPAVDPAADRHSAL